MTAFDDIGGEGPIRAVLQELYDRLFEDPIVGFLFEGKDKARIVEQQVAFTSAFLGGPNRYTGKALPEVHAPLPLLPGHFDRRHLVLKQALEAHHVPEGVRDTWLRIDAGLRSSVLATGEESREMTRKAP
jgi:hemoglobin